MKLLEATIGILAPLLCQGCGREGAVICDACLQTVRAVPSRCYRCHKATKEFRTCQACRRKTPIRRVVPLAGYEGVVLASIHALKYARLQQAASALVCMRPCPVRFKLGTMCVPVPTTSRRVRIRGYDQAILLAKSFAIETGLEQRLLLARSGQRHQVGASGKQRREQLRGVFTVRSSAVPLPRQVVLIDDVLTTGSTLEEAAKALHAAGVKKIDAVVVAQA
ncbi:MAG: phosphoribosyltransferase family protein [Candidatus Saccharimonadales bacterium]